MQELSKKLGAMEYDGLISGLTPPPQVGGLAVPKVDDTTYKRGTVFGTDKDGAVVVMTTGATPTCILCDDLDAGALTTGENVPVYTAGCFDPDKLTVATGYTLTAADIDKLRSYGIVLKAAAK